LLRESKLGRRYLHWVEAGPTALLHRLAFQPIHLTFSALFFSVLVIPAFLHSFWLGGLALLFAGVLDTLDGALARKAGRTSPSGAFLDSVLDRASDFVIYLGLWAALVLRVPRLFLWVTLLIFFCIQGSYLVSYARARGEGLGVSTTAGVFGRAERLVTLALGSIINDLLRMVWPHQPWLEQQGFILGVLLLLALGVHLSALQRIFYLFRQLKEPISKL
jgi:CDP-diacylglycerol---glycerol-3-phosphate 3-phosphatidyltransferase